MTENAATGKKIITRANNLFVCLTINGRDYFFYLNSTGDDRFVSPKEVQTCESPDVYAWRNALKKWEGAKEIALSEEENKSALRIREQIKNDFFYGFTEEQLNTVREQQSLIRP